MKSWQKDLTLYDIDAEDRHALHACFNPTYEYHQKPTEPHRYRTQGAVNHALDVITWMRTQDVGVIWIEDASDELRHHLKETLKAQLIQTPPFTVDETSEAFIVDNIHASWDPLKKLSYRGSLFIYTPMTTQIMSFGDVVSDDIPPRSSDTYMLSRLFYSGVESWFLASILDQLTPVQRTWMLEHLDSPFVESLSVNARIMSSSMKAMVMYVEDFTEVIKKLFTHQFMDELQTYSFGFVYHFMFQH